jgi:hypothetical protein
MTWNNVTTATVTMSSNNGYLANYNGTCVLTLPTTSAIGDVIQVIGVYNKSGFTWQIAQNAGQGIVSLGSSTTVGTTGYVEGQTKSMITLVCSVANTTWTIEGVDVLSNYQFN